MKFVLTAIALSISFAMALPTEYGDERNFFGRAKPKLNQY